MPELLPGTQVTARGLSWEVVSIQSLGPQQLYRLRGLEGAVRGQELDVLHPFEPIEPVIQELQPDRAAPLRNWLVYHQAFLLDQALGPDALLTVQPGRLRIEPYQMVPVLRALRMSRVRLLLADGVGLGKTIQAGLVLSELIARRIAHRILVVAPAGPLLDQWKTEMSERFGLRLDVIDRARLEEIRRGSEMGANPFNYVSLGLVSIDFLKQESVLDQLERASYDVVVIDEAHHCMEVGAAADREDSQRRRLALVLARCSDALLLLTATPHDGNDRSLASLCELLDPSLVDGRGSLRGERYKGHVIRRLKSHIKDPVTGKEMFKRRKVIPRPVSANPSTQRPFVELHRNLLDLIAPELRRAFRARRYSDVLAFIALLKRSVSTVEAFRSTLNVVADRFNRLVAASAETQESRRQRLRTLRDYQRKVERFGTVSAAEEAEQELLEAEELAQQLLSVEKDVRSGSRQLTKTATVLEALESLIDLADAALGCDPKLTQLAAELEAIRKVEPKANVLIYTEYTSSQRAVVRHLQSPGFGPVLMMSGEDDEKARRQITERFRTEDNLVLVSTDAAAEGLNLHQRCHHLLHLELPFNPNKLEQRNGRIDRYGQEYDPIVRYLYLRGTFEERILLRLIAKYERMQAKLTFVPDILGVTTSTDAASERLLKGLVEEDAQLFKQQDVQFDLTSETQREDEGADEATRELLEEIDRSLKGFQSAMKTHSWLADAGLNAEEKLLREADQARLSGDRAGAVDLASFVCDAVRLDGGDLTSSPNDDVFTLRLPPAWAHSLDDLPGYDGALRSVRLTRKLDITRSVDGHAVGFIGRAHPLVRKALDRVRNISFGGDAAHQDARASVAKGPVIQATLPAGAYLRDAGKSLGVTINVTEIRRNSQTGTVESQKPAMREAMEAARKLNQRFHDLLRWPLAVPDLQALAAEAPSARPQQTGDIDDPGPWLEAYAAGVGSPLELKFLKLFEQHGFKVEKQVPISPTDGEAPISVVDFAVPEARLAVYVDGAAFHTGPNLRRDTRIRERLQQGTPPWRVIALRAADLAKGALLVAELKRAANGV